MLIVQFHFAKCPVLEMIKFIGKELGQFLLDKYIISYSDLINNMDHTQALSTESSSVILSQTRISKTFKLILKYCLTSRIQKGWFKAILQV